MPTTYYLAVAFSKSADPIGPDSEHLEAQYGFGADSGNGVSALGPGSGSGHRQFEPVNMSAGTGGQPNQLKLALFSDDFEIDQANSFVRIAFRPGHDATPAGNPPLSPLNGNDTTTVGQGLAISASGGGSPNQNGQNYGLDNHAYTTGWMYGPWSLQPVPSGTNYYEVTVELVVKYQDGSTTYIMVDPEMIIGGG